MKTIEEAAKEYATDKSSSSVFQKAHIEDFKAGVAFAQRWIDVNEELPKNGSIILVRSSATIFSTALYNNCHFYIQSKSMAEKDVKSWRPIDIK